MAMGSADYARALATRAAQHASAEGALEIHERWEHVALMQPHTIAAIIRMATDPRFDITAWLPRIQAPTLLLTPGASEVLNADGQPTMSALIPQCEQVVFANAPHTIFFDYRQQCIDAARDFIGRHRID